MKKIFFYFWVFLLGLIFTTCSSDMDTPTNSDNQFAEAIETFKGIARQGGDIILKAIDQDLSSGELLDVNKIAKEIEALEGVESATPTESGAVIIIKQKNGFYSNLLVVERDNEKLFKSEVTKSSPTEHNQKVNLVEQFSDLTIRTRTIYPDYILPTGRDNNSGKALILAPYQYEFQADISLVAGLLENAGYEVTIISNEDSDVQSVFINDFSGNYLTQFDIIYLDTHGAAEVRTISNQSATVFFTSNAITAIDFNTIVIPNKDLLAFVAKFDKDSMCYAGDIAVSAQWIKATSEGSRFPDSWFFANACESYKTSSGSGSMAATLIDMGVVGYNGYKEVISNLMAIDIGEKMTSDFTSGINFEDASKNVLSDGALKMLQFNLQIKEMNDTIRKSINVDLFKYNNTSKPFYIVPPDESPTTPTITLTTATTNQAIFYLCGTGTVTIDWGDETTPEVGTIFSNFPNNTTWNNGRFFRHIYSNEISHTINITGKDIHYFSDNDNRYTNIDASGCTTLISLSCSQNLKSINVSGCTALQTLTCANNQLTSIDVSGCMALRSLYCDNNQLTNLNVNGLTALISLHCQNNQLTSINVSGLTALNTLWCQDNQIEVLNVNECIALRFLNCYNNKILSEIPTWFRDQVMPFVYDQRYNYNRVLEDGRYVTKYTDSNIGWWYPGEPEKGYHGW